MGKKILVVDDERDLVSMIELRLESVGFDVVKSYDGKDALEKTKEANPDLIVLDVMMPHMSGYDVCKTLKSDESYKHIPIILLTARGQGHDVEMGEESGANEYLTKPFDNEVLVLKIKELLGE